MARRKNYGFERAERARAKAAKKEAKKEAKAAAKAEKTSEGLDDPISGEPDLEVSNTDLQGRSDRDA